MDWNAFGNALSLASQSLTGGQGQGQSNGQGGGQQSNGLFSLLQAIAQHQQNQRSQQATALGNSLAQILGPMGPQLTPSAPMALPQLPAPQIANLGFGGN